LLASSLLPFLYIADTSVKLVKQKNRFTDPLMQSLVELVELKGKCHSGIINEDMFANIIVHHGSVPVEQK